MDEITTISNYEYFASSVKKGKSEVVAILYFKNYIKVFKILKCTFLDKFPQNINVFALNFQIILILQEVGQDKTKETMVSK